MRLGRFRWVPRVGATAVVVIVALGAVGEASAAKPGTVLYTKITPGTDTWTVPNGVKRATFDLLGASGGNILTPGHSLITFGGFGGETTATLNVQPGQVFEIVVGGRGGNGVVGSGGGTGGSNGGGTGFAGGGGASDIRLGSCAATTSCDLGARILVAGGGGGAGTSLLFASCDLSDTPEGGSGGGSTGGSGGGATLAGAGGTQTAGGAGGDGGLDGVSGGDGAFGVGGDGRQGTCAAGTFATTFGSSGGGGGWFGGGGGAITVLTTQAGGGGGGSGYISPILSGSSQNDVQMGNGQVVITKD